MVDVLEQYGPYTRIRRLGIGGMAETFLAVQRGAAGFEQRVCMKFILPGFRENADFRRLFLREASIAASLRHSNIVGVIDVDEHAGYMVLELVDGVDLRALLNAAPNHRLSAELATLITLELCKALAYAHGRNRRGQFDGIVHRDISPSNVLVSYAGEVKLTDFGVARAMRSDAEPLSTTVKGKLCYMSPEQARGQVLDGRSDLFALGVVCYELLSGQRPFDGATDAETLLRVTAGQHTPLIEVAPDVPGGLAMVVEKLLSRDREQRYVSADACIDALARFAPRATCFRELGELARSARPHETLPSYDVALDSTVPSRSKLSPITQTVGLADSPSSRALRTSPSSAGLDLDDEIPATGLFGRSIQRVNRNAWGALGVSLVLLLGVASAWAARLSVDPTPPIAPSRPLPPATAGTSPQPLEEANNLNKLNTTTLPTETGITGPSNQVEPPAREVPVTPPPMAASNFGHHARVDDGAKGTGTLSIGVLPPGQVWIDGKLIGWAPQKVDVRAGSHNVAAGNTRPEVRRTLRVKPGETLQFVFNLDRARGGDDATLEPVDR